MRQIVLLVIVLLLPNQRLSTNIKEQLILWDVGQGQWLTMASALHCLHIDMGGEHMDWKSLMRVCSRKPNYVLLTHGDWDHIRFLKNAHWRLKDLCRLNSPREELPTTKQRFLASVPVCRNTSKIKFEELAFHPKPETKRLRSGSTIHKKLDANAYSRVFQLKNKILVPGDSTAPQEKRWSQKILKIPIAILIAGHHGSQTSTSISLLSALPSLKLALCSARKVRYGHPHSKVIDRLTRFKIPLVCTEAWGHIRLLLVE